MNTLKSLLLIILLAVVFVSCKDSGDKKLEELQTKLEDKKEAFESLKIDIEQLEEEIALLTDGNGEVTGRLVTTRNVDISSFSHFIDVQGVIEADKNVNLTSEMNGVVSRILVREGENVRSGQTLVRLNDELVRRNIAEVQTSLDLATTTYERQKNLWEQNIGSEMQYLQAKNQKESLENNLATLQTQLGKMAIKSPIDGAVDEVFVRIGDMLSPGTPAVRVVNLDDVYVKADVPERFLSVVYPGEKVIIRFPAIGIEKEAEISSVGQFINPGNRTFKVDIRLENPEGLLKPNLLSIVRIMDYHTDEALVIPTRLVQHYFDEEFVYVIEQTDQNGQPYARKRTIETGKTYGGYTEIIDGLDGEEKLVDAGFRDIADGQKVRLK